MALGVIPNRSFLVGLRVRIYFNNVKGNDSGYYIGTVLNADEDGVRIEPEHKFVPWVIFPWEAIQMIMPEE